MKTLFILNDAPYGSERSYNALRRVVRTGAQVDVCGTCMDARAIEQSELVAGMHRSSMEELAAWTRWADKLLVF